MTISDKKLASGKPLMAETVHVIGGGLAGSEAAFQIAEKGIPVILHEMRPQRMTDAHQTQGLAELVCSNSFRSDDVEHNAVGLLHEEMRRSDSLIMSAGDANRVPAGGAMAVDRIGFSEDVTSRLSAHPAWKSQISAAQPARLPDEEIVGFCAPPHSCQGCGLLHA